MAWRTEDRPGDPQRSCTAPTPPFPWSLAGDLLCRLTWIVFRVHVIQPPWPHGTDLNNGFLIGVGEVCHAGTEGEEAARRQWLGLVLFGGHSAAKLERARHDGNHLGNRVRVRRDVVVA